jgi:ABC-2 type transport system ATP-binding protein
VTPWEHRAVREAATALEARDLRKRFGEVDALRGLSVTVRTGEIYGLLGPNGSGKTTFIRCVAGLVRPDGGTLTVLGGSPSAAVRAGKIGYMTQAAALYAELSIDENLRFFAALMGLRDPSARIAEVLRTVELQDRRRSTVGTLSGGMRQRVSLAAALLHDPRLLLLDEPTVGIDPALRRDFWRHFRSLADGGVTILVSSHVMDEAGRCDRLGLIRDGRVLAEGSAMELVSRAGTSDLESAFLALSEG